MKNNKFSALILSSIISITSMVFFAFNKTYAITYDNLQKTELKNLHGWTKINGKWYFTNNSGKKVKSSWLYNHDKWYYMTHDGSMKIGWLKYNNKWYYFDENEELIRYVGENKKIVENGQKLREIEKNVLNEYYRIKK